MSEFVADLTKIKERARRHKAMVKVLKGWRRGAIPRTRRAAICNR